MLEWMTGSSRPIDAQYAAGDASYLGEPPETPAHMFAVRAFKTAIFGTPHPDGRIVVPVVNTNKESVDAQVREQKPEVAAPAGVTLPSDNQATDSNRNVDTMASPAKGILMTPGTGATRRKTVSFSHLEAKVQSKRQVPRNDGSPTSATQTKANDQPIHSTLTQTLIEMSKQRPSETLPEARRKSAAGTTGGARTQEMPDVKAAPMETESVAEHTIDLSQPCSKSGQHWKAEYEQYHKKSNREMKKIIKYGQNVKSYAVKKDFEATSLAERLKKETQKVASMENQVSRLAKKLSLAGENGPEAESDTAKLVSELAQKTAQAIRYKEKVGLYKKAFKQQSKANHSQVAQNAIQLAGDLDVGSDEDCKEPFADVDVQSQLESLQLAAIDAEEKAANLETENTNLKRSLARVKEEMMSYESRRQAREERLKKQEEKHKAAKDIAEAELEQLKSKHQELLKAIRYAPIDKSDTPIQYAKAAFEGFVEVLAKPLETRRHDDADVVASNRTEILTPQSQTLPLRRHLQQSTVDIWALSSPNEAAAKSSPTKARAESPPSSVRHDIHRTLKEIHQNLVAERQSTGSAVPLEGPAKEAVNVIDSITKPYPRSTQATSGCSIASRVRVRTNLKVSMRGLTLPADRAAAAKARLAQRNAEKKGWMGSIGA